MPAVDAPSINAESFTSTWLSPIARQAISSSRSASRGAADGHPRQAMLHQQHQQAQHGVEKDEFQVGVVADVEKLMDGDAAILGPAGKLEAKQRGDGTGTPLGPPVKLTQLLSTGRIISPKPRVTMAR